MMLSKHSIVSKARFSALYPLLLLSTHINAIALDLSNPDSIREAASVAAYGLVNPWYKGNETGGTPGNLVPPYYWWEAGAAFMSLIDYWYYTGDTSYNDITTQALLWQTGPYNDFMVVNQTKTEGNDDQAFWGFAAMTATELKFPNPPEDQPQWLALAQAVFNLQTTRWDNTTCAGGLKWQIFPFNTGYNYKNGISNGCYFNLASRLYRYTGNETYHVWADKMYDWVSDVGLVSSTYEVFDGTNDLLNCSEINHDRWSYNAGVFLHGAASMWNKTQDEKWKTRVDGFVASLSFFFHDDVMYEPFCEVANVCNNDQMSFKAYLSRWMAVTTQLAPWTASTIMPLLQKSAAAAAAQCGGGDTGQVCGLSWLKGSAWDGNYGPGQQMAAMQVISSNLVGSRYAPVTGDTGGTSKGNPSAGSGGDTSTSKLLGHFDITTGDRVGAWILTAFFAIATLGGALWTVL